MSADKAQRISAVIQIIIISLIILYGTVSLFLGRFEGMLVTFPFLLFYYIYVVAAQRRKKSMGQVDEDVENGDTGSQNNSRRK